MEEMSQTPEMKKHKNIFLIKPCLELKIQKNH